MRKAGVAFAFLMGLAAVPARGQPQTWSMVESLGPVSSIAIDPFDSLHVLAATGGGLLETRDGGAHWETRPIDSAAFRVVFDQRAPGVAFAACFVYGGLRDNGVYVSTDGGATWSPTALAGPKVEVLSLAVGDFPADRVFAAVSTAPGFATIEELNEWSDDEGVSWKPFPSGNFVTEITPAPAEPIVYALASGGLVRSDDSGASWQPLVPLPSSCSPGDLTPITHFDLAVDPLSPETVYAASVTEHFDCTRCGGFARSEDGAGTWQALDAGEFVTTIAVDPVRWGVVYAGEALREYQGCPGEAHTLLRSEDGGATWSAFDAGLGGLDVLTIAVDPKGGRLYAGTVGGIYVLDLPSAPGRPRVTPVPASPAPTITRAPRG